MCKNIMTKWKKKFIKQCYRIAFEMSEKYTKQNSKTC